jgi:hypothetical protein
MNTIRTAVFAAVIFLMAQAAAAAAPIEVLHSPTHAATARFVRAPWIEGVTPPLENRLFDATYRVLPSHNVLKVYVFHAAGYESAGIRFSARVPHEPRDLSAAELDREAAELIRTTFDDFPGVETVDVWATIPVANSQATQVESTVFSVSADRATYESIREDGLTDTVFLDAFGRVWTSPQVQP